MHGTTVEKKLVYLISYCKPVIKDQSLLSMEFPPESHNSVAQALKNYVNFFCTFFPCVSWICKK